MGDDTRLCPETGKVLKRGLRPMTITYKGLSSTFDMPGWYPTDGGDEGICNGRDMRVSDRELHRLKARSEGLLQPEDVRRIRRKLKLSQKRAGQLLGGGPNAFQKYESGEVLISRAASNLLRLLDRRPDQLSVIADRPERPDAETPPDRVA